MEVKKEDAKRNFEIIIRNSWTYERMTEAEKKRLEKILNSKMLNDCLKGSYAQRWQILHLMYYSFLNGLEYDPINWREQKKDVPLF